MFPVPAHLPRTAAPGALAPGEGAEKADAVLDLLGPLFAGGQELSVEGVRGVQTKLQEAITDNKQRTHQLVLDNFPDISSHIRLGADLGTDFASMQRTLEEVEQQLDPTDAETSFLPPVLTLLDRHFTAVQAKARAEAHIKALKSLQRTTERIDKLEEAIWAGRGADEWVVDELSGDGYKLDDAEGILGDTQALKAAQQRLGLFRSMVVEQVSDAFGKAVSFKGGVNDSEHSLKVQLRTSLQQPRIPRPVSAGSTSSTPPPYSLSHLYSTLSSFGSLRPTLDTLRTKLLRDLVAPLVGGDWKASTSSPDQHVLFQLEKSPSRSPKQILNDVSTLLSFIDEHVISTSDDETVQAERTVFLADLTSAVFEAVKSNVLITSMPPSLASIPTWLDVVHQALSIEEAHPYGERVILPFFQLQAGEAWANQRRTRVGEEVRKLIVGGWGGWEAKEAERERVVTMVVEVEVEDEDMGPSNGAPAGEDAPKTMDDTDDGFGWGFDDEANTAPAVNAGQAGQADGDDGKNGETAELADDGWGFDASAEAGPSSPRQSPVKSNGKHESMTPAGPETGEGDGWDFDMDPAPAPEPPKPILAKPAREAKKLGKKVAKAKAVEDDDPWGSGSESMQSSQVLPPPPQDVPASGEAEGWGWDEPEASAPQAAEADQRNPAAGTASTRLPETQTRAKRKELKEQTRTIQETLLISRACDKLVDIAERVLREARELQSNDLPSPSFAVSSEILLAAATNVFDLHRSLLPSHFVPQLRDVPTLSMQLHNDALHLADCVVALAKTYPAWTDSELIALRLRALADHAFETQLASQRDGIMEVIDEADGFATVGSDQGLRKAERAVQGVVYNVDTLARVLRVVLPTTTYLAVIGYLLDEAVLRITSDILDLRDITEVESERINDLLKPIRGLEEAFTVQEGQPSNIVAHVPHWLKFCYVSELLQANLVDILYLFDSGALIDFTTSELVSLIRALFADSEKRDDAIERIEKGETRAGEASGASSA